MDIKKFNKVLSTKVAKAKSYEKHDDLETAIELWLEISDLTLKASKQPNLEFSYRNMLINKTEQIIAHIKELKSPKKEEPIFEDIMIEDEIIEAPESKEEKDIVEKDFSAPITQNSDKTTQITHKIIKDSDVKIMPGGIKEIEVSKDFKIITPHDPEYVEKMKKLSEEEDRKIHHKPITANSEDVKDLGDKRICFACGTVLPPNTKICTECGTKLS